MVAFCDDAEPNLEEPLAYSREAIFRDIHGDGQDEEPA
jgi:hypothetical protein